MGTAPAVTHSDNDRSSLETSRNPCSLGRTRSMIAATGQLPGAAPKLWSLSSVTPKLWSLVVLLDGCVCEQLYSKEPQCVIPNGNSTMQYSYDTPVMRCYPEVSVSTLVVVFSHQHGQCSRSSAFAAAGLLRQFQYQGYTRGKRALASTRSSTSKAMADLFSERPIMLYVPMF